MIHVAYRLWGGDGFYAKMLGVSMLSMFEHTKKKVTVHVMHNERLTLDNRDKFCYIAGQFNQQVEFHNVEEIAGATLRKFEEAYPLKSGINAAWYPLIVHEVFPNLDKIIFLGTDTVFNLDVGELWEYDLDGYGIGAIPECCNELPKNYFQIIVDGYVDYEDYFNVDVMLLKPAFFKDNFDVILKGLEFVNRKRIESNYRYYVANEQDTLSYLFSKNYLKLPGKFNVIMRWKRQFHPEECLRIEKSIYHFADPSAKPSLDTKDIFNKLYLEYFLKTPWATADMFGNIHDVLDRSFRKLNNQSKNNLLHLTNLLSTRRRAFVINDKFLEQAKKIFEIKDDELVITFSNEIKGIIKEMTAAKGEKVFYFLLSNYLQYWQLRNFLIKRDFVEGTDFVNGLNFLSEQQGIKFNFDSKPIVQKM